MSFTVKQRLIMEKRFNKILYRPFDVREVFYNNNVIELPRYEVMKHMLEENLALLTMRRIRTPSYDHFLVTENIIGKDAVSVEDACYVFPLYLYTTPNKRRARCLPRAKPAEPTWLPNSSRSSARS